MSGESFTKSLYAAVVSTALIFGTPYCHAQSAPGGIPGFIKLPASVVADFRADAAKFLDNYKSGGLPLSNEIKDLVLSDPSLLSDILTAAKTVTGVQAAAIGAGLAEAARAAAPTDPQLAGQIQTQVVSSGLAELIAAYTAVSNATVTTSTGGGGGGAGGGAGGGVGGPIGGVATTASSNSGSNSSPGSSGTSNSASFNSISAGGSPPSGGTATAATTSTSPTATTQ